MADIVKIYRVSVPANTDSYVEWTECEGFGSPRHLIYDKNRSIDFAAIQGTVSASSAATITPVGDCYSYPSCECSYDPLPPTTTTTTLAVVNFTLTPYCTGSGINGTGTINVNTFTGGNGVYQSVGIGSTSGEAFAATPINLSGASSYEFTGLFNGTYHIILRDSLGNYIIKNTIVDCLNTTSTTSTTSTTTSTTSTSTTSTTSTTTAAPICTYNGGSAVITYTTTTTSTTTIAPTTTTTTTSAPTTTTTTTTVAPGINVYVYAKDIGSATLGTPEIMISVNSGPLESIGFVTSATCDYVATITEPTISEGDSIVFTDYSGIAMRGSMSTCPAAPTLSSYTYNVSGGTGQFVYLSFDSDAIL